MAKLSDNLKRLKRGASDLLRGSPKGLSREGNEPFAPFETEGFVVQCHAAWPADEKLIAAWAALSRTNPDTTPMHSPAWQKAAFDASGATTLRLITVYKGDELQLVAPMQLSAAGGLGTIGHWMTDYLEPPCTDPAAWLAFIAFLTENWDRRLNEVVFHNIRESFSFRSELSKSDFFVNEEVIDHAPVIELPKTWEEYLDSLDAHDRKETRRKLNKAEEKGGAKLVAGSVRDLDEAVRLVEAAGGQKGDTVRRFLRPLLTCVGPSLIADGRLELLKLQIDGKFAACLLQFPTPSGPMLYNAGHNPSMREWSPGVVAVAMAIRRAIERGKKTYDLMRGREPYKYRFGAVDRPLYRITLRKK